MDERYMPSHRELLEDLLAMTARQNRLLEEIRDLLSSARRSPLADGDPLPADRIRLRSHN